MTRRFTPFLASLFLCLMAFNNAMNAQTLVCNGHTNISANATCSTTITAEMVATSAPAGATVTVMNGTNPIAQPLNNTHIDKIYTVKVSDGANSCWGTIKIEDKAAPVITCAASPQDLPCATTSFPSPVVTENCGTHTLTFNDVIDDKNCSVAALRAVVTRTWIATDTRGNSASCTVVHNLLPADIMAVTTTMPADITLSCSGTFAKDANGNPAVSATGAPLLNGISAFPSQGGYCDISANYQDIRTKTCGNAYEIVRKWLLIDVCTGSTRQHKQIIVVKDNVAPVFTNCVTTDLLVSVNSSNKCELNNYTVPTVKATDDCGEVTITSVLKDATNTNQVAVGPIFNNVILGNYVLNYTATDACGNSATCSRNFLLADNTPPVAVCDLNTKVSLSSDGTAKLAAVNVDNGSLDNCCFDVNRFEIKRATAPDTDYKPVLDLNCNDANLMVALRVWDCFNNSNVCMVNILVEDKLPPVITAKDTTVICGNNTTAETWLNLNKPAQKTLLADLPTATNPGWYDNCGAEVSFTDKKEIDNCGNGTYTRTWTVKEKAGQKFSATTVQKYISTNASSFKVVFPKDTLFVSSSSCDKTETGPEKTGRPVITALGNTCPLVGIEYTDEVFQIADGNSCYKIVRTWKTLSWCNHNTSDPLVTVPSNPKGATVTITTADRGYLEYKQLIKVVDNVPPSVAFKPYTLLPVGKECKAELTIVEPDVTDNCSGVNKSYSIVDANNVVLVQGTTFPAKYTFVAADFGKTYTIRYTASDKCGNATSSAQTVTVKDVTKPTPICHNGLAVDLMLNGMVMVNAAVLDAGSYDNCTPKDKLKFKIQYPVLPPPNDVKVTTLPDMHTFMCSDTAIIPTNDDLSVLVNVGLWVCDEAGNADYCETYIIIQDNNLVCDYKPIQMKNIAGAIATEKNSEVEAVKINISGGTAQSQLSNLTGGYAFKNLSTKEKYIVTPEKNEDPLNGVSTLDLILMSKHILGVQSLATPAQFIAGDVNKSGSVSTADIVELRKMILGVQSQFTKNTSWRFVDKSFVFDATTNPLQQNFNEQKTIEPTANINTPANFMAVKIGDINGNATTKVGQVTGRNDMPSKNIVLENKSIIAGENFQINLTTPQGITAFQTTFEYDEKNIELVDIEGVESNFAIIQNGLVTISTEKENPIALNFKAKNDLTLAQNIRLTSSITTSEAYDNNNETFKMAFDFGQKNQVNNFDLHQNRPNPFRDETVISFQLPQNGRAKLSITDITGKAVKTFENDFAKGYNELKISKKDLNAANIYYIKLEYNGMSATKKMLSIE